MTDDIDDELVDSKKRDMVFARDGYRCQFCGFVGKERFPDAAPPHQDDPIPLHLHHIIPKSKGGTNDLDNLITMCRRHHQKLHHDPSPDTLSSGDSLPEIVGLPSSIGDTDSTEVDVLKFISANGPVRTGQVADACDISKEHSRRLLYRLGAEDLVLPTGDGGYDLSDRVSDPPVGSLPDDPKLAAIRVRDEMLRRVAAVLNVDDSDLAEIADVSPRTARVSVDRAKTYKIPLPDAGPGSDSEYKSVTGTDDGDDGTLSGFLRYTDNNE